MALLKRNFLCATATASALIFLVYKYINGRKCTCKARLDNFTVVITGANSGIGKSLAYEVATRGATIVLACRNLKEAAVVQTELILQTGNTKIHIKHLDLNSIDSIKAFSSEINSEFRNLFALVNNAGVFYHPQIITDDGFDVTFQVNYLGPFLLTHLLLNTFKHKDARVINVVSDAHRLASIADLEYLTTNQAAYRNHFTAYAVSKIALVLFTKKLAALFKSTNIKVVAVDPGNVETNIFRNFPLLSNPILFALQYPLRLILVKRPAQGAQTLLHALLVPDSDGSLSGQYLANCEARKPSQIVENTSLVDKYYELTLNLLKGHIDRQYELQEHKAMDLS